MAKRRTFTPEFKLQVVLEALSGTKSNAEICREHQVAPTVVSACLLQAGSSRAWKERFVQQAPEIFATRQSVSVEQQRIAELERLVGRLALELEVAKKASSILTSLSARNGR